MREELAFHLERETRKHLTRGMSPVAARRRAAARFGSLARVADACRDARGTAMIDDVARDVLYALRTFQRAPLAALTIVVTVALGLGLVAAVFTLVNVFLFRVDEVRRPHELFAVELTNPGDLSPGAPSTAGVSRVRFTRPDFEAMRRETDVFSDLFAMLPDLDSRIDGRMMAGTLVSGNFFQALGVTATLGRALTPVDDDEFRGGPVMVLSHRGWSRHFASDPSVIGDGVIVNGVRFEIVGVMPEGFRGLSVGPPDYWAPLSLVGRFWLGDADREQAAIGVQIVGRLKEGISRQAALASLVAWDVGSSGGGQSLPGQPLHLTLEPRQGTIEEPLEAALVSTPLFFAFGLILAIGCANVANLLVARGVARQRELGIRLSLGASRSRVVRQLLTESLLLALVAAGLAFVISRVVLEGTVRLVMSTLAPELAESVPLTAPDADWRVPLFLLGAAIGATGLFGLAPALQTTRLELVRTMRGELTRGARPSRSRQVLIGVQVTASALLLICSGIFLRSAADASRVGSRIRTEDTIVIQVVNEQTRPALVEAVQSDPAIESAAASWPGPVGPRTASAQVRGERSPIAFRLVSPEYFSVLGIGIVRGRGFQDDERSSLAGVAIVSEAVAGRLWPGEDALGQVLGLEPGPRSGARANEPPFSARSFTVIGVARDVAAFRLSEYPEEAGVYVPISFGDAGTTLIARAYGDPAQARLGLLQRLTAVDPNLGEVRTLAALAGLETYLLGVAFWLTLTLGGLALTLTLSGLFSVLSYLIEQQRKEIGIRLALGASAQHVVLLILGQTARPVAFGLAAGAGLALALATVLMATPAAEQIGRSIRVFDPVAYAVSLLIIAGASQLAAWIPVRQASRIDPIASVRQD